MIVVDTGVMLALLDASEEHHAVVRRLYEARPDAWILPSAILPEVDYLLRAHLGARAQDVWLDDLGTGAFAVEWSRDEDLASAVRIHTRHRALRMGLVDALVMATAERLNAEAIATFDLRHFGPVALKGRPRLLPRDL